MPIQQANLLLFQLEKGMENLCLKIIAISVVLQEHEGLNPVKKGGVRKPAVQNCVRCQSNLYQSPGTGPTGGCTVLPLKEN